MGYSERQAKRERVLGRGGSPSGPKGFGRLWADGRRLLFFFLVAALVGGAAVWLLQGREPGEKKETRSQAYLSPVSYRGAYLEQEPVEARVERGQVKVSLREIEQRRLVRFLYVKAGPDGKEGETLPLLAYVAPSGKVVAAVSMCEPCNSTSFHIEENHLVCNACYTRWELEDLRGVQGGCLEYPPDELPSRAEDGFLVIPEEAVAGWRPRV
ncbi:MAG: Fe-S-containing protein [Bacillota bacterium]|nr:Fe-S-containing protein [Bacillota bacterium]